MLEKDYIHTLLTGRTKTGISARMCYNCISLVSAWQTIVNCVLHDKKNSLITPTCNRGCKR